MAGIELEAFRALESLGCNKNNEYYSPSKAEESFYSTKLRHVKQLYKAKALKETIRIR
jgi:hypothetical protein